MEIRTIIIFLSIFLPLCGCSHSGDQKQEESLYSIPYSETTPFPKEGKKVLILSSSPHPGGNTDRLCDAFAEGAELSGGVVEKVFLYDYRLTPLSVREIEERSCDDDSAILVDKMMRADVIVLASPVWFMNVTGQMKMLFDKTYFKFTELNDKEFYFITCSADDRTDSCERAILAFKGFVQVLPNAVHRGSITVPSMGRSGAVRGTEYIQRAFELGKTINQTKQ